MGCGGLLVFFFGLGWCCDGCSGWCFWFRLDECSGLFVECMVLFLLLWCMLSVVCLFGWVVC